MLGVLLLLAASPESSAPKIHYAIEVQLVPERRALIGREEIRWTNPSTVTLSRLPLHLYLNGFAHSETTWMRTSRVDPQALLARSEDPWGFIDVESITQKTAGGQEAVGWRPIQPDEPNALDRSLIELDLPRPIGPEETVQLEVKFTAQLPVPIARTGGERDFFLVAQWFPKIAVLEVPGVRGATRLRWAAHQFHGPTEFYADFADWEVTIEVPPGWVVGATGKEAESAGDRHRFVATRTHDFAWVAGSNLSAEEVSYRPMGDGAPIQIRYLAPPHSEAHVARARAGVEAALEVLSARVGVYPYETLTVVIPPPFAEATAGMEYPTLVVGATADPLFDAPPFGALRLAELASLHEVAHQYFYGLLASDEQEEAFLDEGFTTYWEMEIAETRWGAPSGVGRLFGRDVEVGAERDLAFAQRARRVREPIARVPSTLFYPGTGSNQIYSRPATVLRTARALFGRERLDRVFAEYFQRFAFKHPGREDFLTVALEAGGPELAGLLREALLALRVPDFRVESLEVRPFAAPLGHAPLPTGTILLTEESRRQHTLDALEPSAREDLGLVEVEIIDPGWITSSSAARGGIRRVAAAPVRWQEPTSPAGEDYFVSRARLVGPGWMHLPVDVELRFADGAVIRDRWDGRATWRGYRFVRRAPLEEVSIDPERRIAIDVRPENNGLLRQADPAMVGDLSSWLSLLASSIAAGLSLWL